jgi:ribosomal protein S18 acetylase RimI-like enzyme
MNDSMLSRCSRATSSDISDVVRVHLDAFPGFFLSELGAPFLRVMYKSFLMDANGVFVVHRSEKGELDGFAVGTLTSQTRDRWLALRFLPEFMVAAIPAMLARPRQVGVRLAQRFFDTDEIPTMPEGSAVLRSIGVSGSARGSGAADALLRAFEGDASARGACRLCLTTNEDDNQRAQRFYAKHGYEMVARFQQSGSRRMWLMSKRLGAADR